MDKTPQPPGMAPASLGMKQFRPRTTAHTEITSWDKLGQGVGINVDQTIISIISQPFGNGLYNPFMVFLGMVYYCLAETRPNKSDQELKRNGILVIYT